MSFETAVIKHNPRETNKSREEPQLALALRGGSLANLRVPERRNSGIIFRFALFKRLAGALSKLSGVRAENTDRVNGYGAD